MSDLMNYVLVFGLGLNVGIWGGVLWLKRQGALYNSKALRKATRAAYLDGLNNGSIFAAQIVRKYAGWKCQGFAEACRKCGRIHGIVADVKNEYWACDECSHRQPCPAFKAQPSGGAIK